MENLVLLTDAHSRFADAADCRGAQYLVAPSAVSQDARGSGTAYVCQTFRGRVNIHRHWGKTDAPMDKQQPSPSWATFQLHEPESDRVVDMRYLMDQDALCLILSNGDLLLLADADNTSQDGDSSAQMDCVGTVESGVLAVSWSPDEELLVVVSGRQTLLLLTRDFQVVHECPMHVECFGEAAPVNVGWGKKETQFHGSAGKAAALLSTAQQVSLGDGDDFGVRVSWRGDGAFFCCSSMDPNGEKRVVRVYNREAVLQSTSEPVDKLGQSLAWRPSGGLIASSQQQGATNHQIVFFEKNGLRHGEFSLRNAANMQVVELFWNCDSTVLAVCLKDISATTTNTIDDATFTVELWTSANYHWYRKHVVSDCVDPRALCWDAEHPLRLHYVDTKGCYRQSTFTQDVFSHSKVQEGNYGSMAVVDGVNLLLTCFLHANIPPPMAQFTLTMDQQIQCVAFAAIGEGNNFAILTPNELRLFEHQRNQEAGKLFAPKNLGTWKLNSGKKYRQLVWPFPFVLVALYADPDLGDILDVLETTTGQPVTCTTIRLPTAAIRLCVSSYQQVFVQDIDGQVLEVDLDSSIVTPILQFPKPCNWLHVLNNPQEPPSILGRTAHNTLYLNENTLSSGCTSFSVHADYLVITTLDHYARFLPLHTLDSVNNTTLEKSGSKRRVERGCRVLLSPPGSVNLVLYAPRGNLETVYPRPLVLSLVRRHLHAREYRRALVECRKHRIDMNLLYDEQPEEWMAHVDEFVEQMSEPDYLNLFLSSLRAEDVTKTMYPPDGQSPTASAGQENTGKVNQICDAIRTELERLGNPRFFHTILTTFVRKAPQDLEGTLQRVAMLRQEPNGTELMEGAIRFVSVYVDVNRLYEVALGMYDFGMAILVAQHSNKDPREYLAYLTSIQPLPKFYQRFHIDDHLKRYEKAVANLALAGESYFEELLEYVGKHNLYKVAMDQFSPQDIRYKRLSNAFGESLLFANNYQDAASAFTIGENWEQAMECMRKGGLWRELFAVADRIALPREQRLAYASEMIHYLSDHRRYAEAATVALDYAQIPEECVTLLIKACKWSEALRVASLHGLTPMIASHVVPGICAGAARMMEELQEVRDKFEKYRDRLAVVRTKPATSRALPEEKDEDEIDAFSDTDSIATRISLLSSAISRLSTTASTSRSRQSSRNRRKYERNKHRGKEGSVFEEDYLVDSLRKLILRGDELKVDVQPLVRLLLEFGYRSHAQTLQHTYEELMAVIRRSLKAIFQPPKIHLTDLPVFIKAQLMQAIQEGGQEDLVDAVLHFLRKLPEPELVQDATWKTDLLP